LALADAKLVQHIVRIWLHPSDSGGIRGVRDRSGSSVTAPLPAPHLTKFRSYGRRRRRHRRQNSSATRRSQSAERYTSQVGRNGVQQTNKQAKPNHSRRTTDDVWPQRA